MLLWLPAASLAYRPFDGTDAGVAGLHELEVELGAFGYLKQDRQRFWSAPALVLNYGVVPDAELVAEGQLLYALNQEEGEVRTQLADPELSFKQVLCQGSLQGFDGPSLAAEYGLLLPELHGEGGTGASLAGYISQRWDPGTVHLNARVEETRDHHLDLLGGAILEGPAPWIVRPVAEVFVERERTEPRTLSGLAGAIWQRSDRLAFDLGLRWARAGGQNLRELRAGLTWTFATGG